jgi:metal-responsive CopG/Arc/MetJ family transcriptional regulator
MLSKASVKLSKALCERARVAAEAAGYSSLEEFIEHAIEKELANIEEAEGKEEVLRRLKGLGYIE